jgi:cell wall-associated NlpC family hydrolase
MAAAAAATVGVVTYRSPRYACPAWRPLVVRLSWLGLACIVLSAGIAALLCAGAATAAPPQITAKQREAERILADVQVLDVRVERAVESYNLATIKLQGIEQSLQTNRRELTVAQSNLQRAQAYLQKRLRDLYSADQKNSSLEVLLGASSLDELIDRLDTEDRVSAEDSRILREVITFRVIVKRQRAALRVAQSSQRTVVADRVAKKRLIEGQLAERKRLLSSVQGEIARLQAEEAVRQERLRRQLQARLDAQRREQAARLDATVVGVTADTPDGAPVPPPAVYGGVVGIAMRYLGIPYRWGGASPSGGFDCSGFVMYVYAQIGISLPHNAAAQFSYGTPVSRDQLEPGDLVFFHGLGHNGIYVGGGQFIHAPHTGDFVKISNLSDGFYTQNWVGGRRLS